MKVTPHFLLILLALLLTSCFKLELDTIEEQAPSAVRLITRAADGQAFDAPLFAYAFDDSGDLIAYQQFEAGADLRFSLPQQTEMRLVVLSADPECYDIPSDPALSSIITMKAPTAVSSLAKGYATRALQMGFVDVNPQSDNTTVTIQMHYQVASLSVHLQGLPAECSSAYISVASPAKELTLAGTTNGTQTTRIPLTYAMDAGYGESGSELIQGGTLGKTFSTTEPFYIFPTTGSTTFTIAYNDSNGEQYASATYQAPLQTGTPYQLNGSYSDGTFFLSGTVTPSVWVDPVAFDFAFANGSSTIITPDGDNGGAGESTVPDASGSITVSTMPEPFTLWDGHIVIATDAQASTFTLLSLSDLDGLTSALNADKPTAAIDYAKAYSEFDLTGWRIPTEAEARQLSQLYRDDPDNFDALLSEAQASPIVLTDDKGNNLRYLCDDATRTYSYRNNTVTNAGATVKTYHLRLVRTIQVQQQ